MSLLKTVLPFLTNQATWFISCVIGHSYFSRNFLLSFLLWYDFKIQVESRGGATFLCLASSVNVLRSNFSFNWKLNISSFIFLIWSKQFWIWFNQKLTKNIKFFVVFWSYSYFNPVRLRILGSDLSIDNIVRLDSADTKIGSQDAVNKVLKLMEKWKYPNFKGKF